MSNYVLRAAGTPLSEDEKEESRQLALMPDDQIDFSDIPEWRFPPIAEEKAVALVERTMTVRVTTEVAEWLDQHPDQRSTYIERAIKRELYRFKPSSVSTPPTSLERVG